MRGERERERERELVSKRLTSAPQHKTLTFSVTKARTHDALSHWVCTHKLFRSLRFCGCRMTGKRGNRRKGHDSRSSSSSPLLLPVTRTPASQSSNKKSLKTKSHEKRRRRRRTIHLRDTEAWSSPPEQ